MSRMGWSPGTVPYGADQTIYLVVDRLSSGSVYRETEVERTDLETIIDDFLSGQFNDPVRVVAFNTLEHWANDVSKDIARVIQDRCDMAGDPVPDHVRDFVDSNASVLSANPRYVGGVETTLTHVIARPPSQHAKSQAEHARLGSAGGPRRPGT
jgi:hypothetical protein